VKTVRRLTSVFALIAVFLATPGTAYTQSPIEVVISEIAWMGTTTSYNEE
jgi:hypothetical protein